MNQDLITTLRELDPWPFLAGLMTILWVVEVKFGARARATKEDRSKAMLRGYELAVDQMREAETIKAEGEGYLP